ncbi:MAG: toxin-activating lysine-acyltransferase [Pseudomonadota bacterium]
MFQRRSREPKREGGFARASSEPQARRLGEAAQADVSQGETLAALRAAGLGDHAAPAGAPAGSLDLPSAIRAYGEAMLVFANDAEWSSARIREAHALLAAAARLNQIVIAKGPGPEGALAPVGVAVWAKVDGAIDARLKRLSSSGRRPQLEADEWRSGETPWLIALAGAPTVREATCRKLADVLGRPPMIETFAHGPFAD